MHSRQNSITSINSVGSAGTFQFRSNGPNPGPLNEEVIAGLIAACGNDSRRAQVMLDTIDVGLVKNQMTQLKNGNPIALENVRKLEAALTFAGPKIDVVCANAQALNQIKESVSRYLSDTSIFLTTEIDSPKDLTPNLVHHLIRTVLPANPTTDQICAVLKVDDFESLHEILFCEKPKDVAYAIASNLKAHSKTAEPQAHYKKLKAAGVMTEMHPDSLVCDANFCLAILLFEAGFCLGFFKEATDWMGYGKPSRKLGTIVPWAVDSSARNYFDKNEDTDGLGLDFAPPCSPAPVAAAAKVSGSIRDGGSTEASVAAATVSGFIGNGGSTEASVSAAAAANVSGFTGNGGSTEASVSATAAATVNGFTGNGGSAEASKTGNGFATSGMSGTPKKPVFEAPSSPFQGFGSGGAAPYRVNQVTSIPENMAVNSSNLFLGDPSAPVNRRSEETVNISTRSASKRRRPN